MLSAQHAGAGDTQRDNRLSKASHRASYSGFSFSNLPSKHPAVGPRVHLAGEEEGMAPQVVSHGPDQSILQPGWRRKGVCFNSGFSCSPLLPGAPLFA